MSLLVALAAAVAAAVAGLRWLRVAQREHYLAGSVSRFALRWWCSTGATNLALLAVAAAGAIGVWWVTALGLACVAVVLAGPIGLTPRGRTSPLAWTRRLRTTAVTVAGLDAAGAALGLAVGRPAALLVLVCALQPLAVDAALGLVVPFERRAMARFVRSASARLAEVSPVTIAITGSFGKTSTKVYARHLIAAERSVLASPASFNNTGGLSRTVNELLTPGTEVFIAEMGTYGPGEIAAMCRWVRPSISAIVNIGPVHLERMGSLDGIVAAKSEIAEPAHAVVLNVDAHGLAALADRLEREGKQVLRCSTERLEGVDVAVVDGRAHLGGRDLGPVDPAAQPANAAAAIGLAVAAGVTSERFAPLLAALPAPEHRQQVATAPSGVTVIDNTFSSNPASARSSIELLARHHRPGHRAVVVTPGMVELGHEQRSANRELGATAGAVATDLVIVGRTNRAALDAGAAGQQAVVRHVRTREEAVAWVRATLGPGDVVLYENDLPDHFP